MGGGDAREFAGYKRSMDPRVDARRPPLPLALRGLRFVRYLPHFVRLYWRLLWDRRVSIWPKALLIVSLLYVLSPIDFIPDVIPFVGELDDLVVVIAACRLFMYLCPREVVQEHVRRIGAGT